MNNTKINHKSVPFELGRNLNEKERTISLMGTTVNISCGLERYYTLLRYTEKAQEKIHIEFVDWYSKCGSLDKVLSGCEKVALELITGNYIEPLFGQLANFDIFDIPAQQFRDSCLEITGLINTLSSISDGFSADTAEQNKQMQQLSQGVQKEALRQVKLAPERSALRRGELPSNNTSDGLGQQVAGIFLDSVFEVANKHVSQFLANREADKVYRDENTKLSLLEQIDHSLYYCQSAYIGLLNNRVPGCLEIADVDKSNGYMESSIRYPDRRNEFLAKALIACPWNQALLSYLFINYESDRETVCDIAKHYQVNMAGAVEKILAKEYDNTASQSLPFAQKAKERVLRIMSEYGIAESETLNAINRNSLSMICDGYQNANEMKCQQLLDAVNQYDAPQNIKKYYIDKLQNRIEYIHDEADAKNCGDILLNTDIRNKTSILRAMADIKECGRGDLSELYVKALGACNSENILKAQCHHSKNLINKVRGSKQIWDLLTVNGRTIHPVLMQEPPKKYGWF